MCQNWLQKKKIAVLKSGKINYTGENSYFKKGHKV